MFSLERCRKNQFLHSHAAWESLLFLIRTQRGSAKNNFCDTSPARMRFFHFFDTSPAGSSKIMKMLLLNHLVGVTSPKSRSANRYQNHLYRARTFYLLIFRFIKISSLCSKCIMISNEFTQFTNFAICKHTSQSLRIACFVLVL